MKKFTAILVVTATLFVVTKLIYEAVSEIEYDKYYKSNQTIIYKDNEIGAIQEFLDCMNNRDAKGIMKMSYPRKYINHMWFLNGDKVTEQMNKLQEDLPETVRVIDVLSKEPLGDDERDLLYADYILMQLVTDYVNEVGEENTDPEKSWDIDEFPEPYCKINDIYLIRCLLEFENEKGGAFTEELPFVVWNIDGEGWLTENAMIDYVVQTRHDMVYVFSENLKTYSDWVLDYLAENDIEIPEKCTINSDSTKNENVPDEFLNSFEQVLLCFNDGYEGLDYVIEIEDGCCINAVCEETFLKTPRDENDEEMVHIFTFGDYTLEDIYNSGAEKIQKLITKMKEVKELW
ncbi:MAG: hypothetical protein NC244_12840 [Alistipes senegalensis]|nr:hypothetical protein [Alistipes senegalensis]